MSDAPRSHLCALLNITSTLLRPNLPCRPGLWHLSPARCPSPHRPRRSSSPCTRRSSRPQPGVGLVRRCPVGRQSQGPLTGPTTGPLTPARTHLSLRLDLFGLFLRLLRVYARIDPDLGLGLGLVRGAGIRIENSIGSVRLVRPNVQCRPELRSTRCVCFSLPRSRRPHT